MSILPVDRTPSRWMEAVAAFIAIALCACVIVITILPYYGFAPKEIEPSLVANHESLIQNTFIMVVSFFFGAAVGSRKKDEAISQLAAGVDGRQPPLQFGLPADQFGQPEKKP